MANIVRATTRKRCQQCNKMVDIGDEAVLTDDRVQEVKISMNSAKPYKITTGAWHLWHPKCHEARLADVARWAIEVEREREARMAELRDALEALAHA